MNNNEQKQKAEKNNHEKSPLFQYETKGPQKNKPNKTGKIYTQI
jgi:hypothetical protein